MGATVGLTPARKESVQICLRRIRSALGPASPTLPHHRVAATPKGTWHVSISERSLWRGGSDSLLALGFDETLDLNLELPCVAIEADIALRPAPIAIIESRNGSAFCVLRLELETRGENLLHKQAGGNRLIELCFVVWCQNCLGVAAEVRAGDGNDVGLLLLRRRHRHLMH